MQIIYEPHPVTPERKTELRAAGYKVIDAQFAPEGYVYPFAGGVVDPSPVETPKRGRKAQA